jgi:hypothetical protein
VFLPRHHYTRLSRFDVFFVTHQEAILCQWDRAAHVIRTSAYVLDHKYVLSKNKAIYRNNYDENDFAEPVDRSTFTEGKQTRLLVRQKLNIR